jgi:hypothetical protein
MGAAMPQMMLGMAGPSFPKHQEAIGAKYEGDPDMKYEKQSEFANAIENWERDGPAQNLGLYSKGLRATAEKSKPGDSLITGNDKPKRKRIYGMGKSSGEEKSGTVKKPTLGGE